MKPSNVQLSHFMWILMIVINLRCNKINPEVFCFQLMRIFYTFITPAKQILLEQYSRPFAGMKPVVSQNNYDDGNVKWSKANQRMWNLHTEQLSVVLMEFVEAVG